MIIGESTEDNVGSVDEGRRGGGGAGERERGGESGKIVEVDVLAAVEARNAAERRDRRERARRGGAPASTELAAARDVCGGSSQERSSGGCGGIGEALDDTAAADNVTLAPAAPLGAAVSTGAPELNRESTALGVLAERAGGPEHEIWREEAETSCGGVRGELDDAAAADKVVSEATTAPPDVAVSAGVELNSESATPSVLGGREDVSGQ